MSKIDVKFDFDKKLKSKDEVLVLFYASWCPFSQRFLPIFEKFSKKHPKTCLQIVTDDKTSLCEKYSIDVVPTVLLFEKGKVKKRLDGIAGVGLKEKQLTDFSKTS